MILINLGALMYLWDINLNAISLVNLIMAVGIRWGVIGGRGVHHDMV